MKLFKTLLISSSIIWLLVIWQKVNYEKVSSSGGRRSLIPIIIYPPCSGESNYNIFDCASNTKQQYVASTNLRKSDWVVRLKWEATEHSNLQQAF